MIRKGLTRFGKYLSQVLLSVFCLVISAPAEAQERSMTISLENRPLSELIKAVERQSDKTFFYSTPSIDVNQLISVECKNAVIDVVLKQALKGTSISYSISGRKIMLFPRSTADQKDGIVAVEGTIMDELGKPVIGAYVYQTDNQQNGTVSDINGKFKLNVPASSSIEAVSIGYMKASMPVDSKMDSALIEP